MSLVQAMPLPPSLIVYSGHGLQPRWLLSRPWIFAGPDDRAAAAALVRDWQDRLRQLAAQRGWTLDSTHDLARIMRLPGTFNRKAEPVAVTCDMPMSLKRYDVAELRDALASAPAPPTAAEVFLAAIDHPSVPPTPPQTTPPPLMTDEQIIARARAAKTKLGRLWAGDVSGYKSQSEADLALLNILRDMTAGDETRMEKLFAASELGRRGKWTERADYRQGTIAKAMSSAPSANGQPPPPPSDAPTSSPGAGAKCSPSSPPPAIAVGDVHLAVTAARKTAGGKIVATVAVSRAGARIDVVTVTSTPTARSHAAKTIAQHVPDPAARLKIDLAVGQVITQADELASRPVVRVGESMAEVVARIIAEDYRPAYRTPGGFFAEARGHEVRRQDMIGYTPSRLVAAAADAIDAPDKRAPLLKSLKAELEIFFADLIQSLPSATEAELQEHSAAAGEWRGAMRRLLTMPKTWEAAIEGHPPKRASLISRAANVLRSLRGGPQAGGKPRKAWHRVLDAVSCWCRLHVVADGEVVPYIAVRYEVAHQIGVALPGVVDEDSLRNLGRRYGVINPAPLVPSKAQGVTLAVLATGFLEPLLAAEGDLVDDGDEEIIT